MDNLLTFPIQMSITGKTKSGKSHLLRHHIIPKIIKEYDEVFIFSPTSRLDTGWYDFKDSLPQKQKHKLTLVDSKFTLADVSELVDEIGEMKMRKRDDEEPEKFLLIFDDCTALYSQSKRDIFSELAFKGRHSNISYILTTHKWNCLNTLIRGNLETKMFFRITNEKEIESFIADNKPYNIPKDDFLEMLDSSTGDYKCFVIKSGKNSDDYYRIIDGKAQLL